MRLRLLTIFLFLGASAFSTPLDGVWDFKEAACQGGSTVSPVVLQFLKVTQYEFRGEAVVQSMTISPTCMGTMKGSFRATNDTLSFGLLMAAKSETCPAGLKISDQQPRAIKMALNGNLLTLANSPAGTFCSNMNDVALITLERKTRYLYLNRR